MEIAYVALHMHVQTHVNHMHVHVQTHVNHMHMHVHVQTHVNHMHVHVQAHVNYVVHAHAHVDHMHVPAALHSLALTLCGHTTSSSKESMSLSSPRRSAEVHRTWSRHNFEHNW